MRFLSLWQPWASLVAVRAKRIETRSWRTDYRGPIGIHATATFPQAARTLCWQPAFAQAMIRAGIESPDQLPRGAVLAVVELKDIILIQGSPIGDEGLFGNYEPGRWGWRFIDFRKLPKPIPARGHQGLWTDPELERRVMEALA